MWSRRADRVWLVWSRRADRVWLVWSRRADRVWLVWSRRADRVWLAWSRRAVCYAGDTLCIPRLSAECPASVIQHLQSIATEKLSCIASCESFIAMAKGLIDTYQTETILSLGTKLTDLH